MSGGFFRCLYSFEIIMRIKSQKDFVSGLALIVVGAAFAIGATNYSFGVAVRPGPGYFPFGLGIILALLGVIVLVTSLTQERNWSSPCGLRCNGSPEYLKNR